jgi:hypothetical protein
MQDVQTILNSYDRLLSEFSEHMLDDTEGTIPAFRYSDELIEFMNENEVYEPTAARDLVHDIIEDLWDIRDEAERLAD